MLDVAGPVGLLSAAVLAAPPLQPDPAPPARVAHVAVAYSVAFKWHGRWWLCGYPLHHPRFCVKLPHRPAGVR